MKDQIKELEKDIRLVMAVGEKPREERSHQLARLLIKFGWVKQRKGKWIRNKENCLYNKCSFCSYEHCREDNYCPSCGAKMKGAKHERAD